MIKILDENNCKNISSDKLTKLPTRRSEHDNEREISIATENNNNKKQNR